jgi:hypothetical protein
MARCTLGRPSASKYAKETLIKASFLNFSVRWLGMGPLRWKIAAATSGSQAGCGPN